MPSPHLPGRVRLWLREWLADTLTATSATSFTIAGIGPSYHWNNTAVFALLAGGVLCAGGSIVYNRKGHRPTLLTLTNDNAELTTEVVRCQHQIDSRTANLIDVVNVLLRDLAHALRIYKGDTRLSVYRHSEKEFYLVGRVSPNERYAAVGRKSYPDTQGFIGEIWSAANDRKIVRLPTNRENWIVTQVKEFGFSREEAENLRMCSTVMTAVKLRRDPHSPAFGVLCVECDKPKSTVTATTIDEVEQSLQFKTLTAILDISLADLTHDDVKRGFLDKPQA